MRAAPQVCTHALPTATWCQRVSLTDCLCSSATGGVILGSIDRGTYRQLVASSMSWGSELKSLRDQGGAQRSDSPSKPAATPKQTEPKPEPELRLEPELEPEPEPEQEPVAEVAVTPAAKKGSGAPPLSKRGSTAEAVTDLSEFRAKRPGPPSRYDLLLAAFQESACELACANLQPTVCRTAGRRAPARRPCQRKPAGEARLRSQVPRQHQPVAAVRPRYPAAKARPSRPPSPRKPRRNRRRSRSRRLFNLMRRPRALSLT